jgi:flagellar hook-associated protein 2
MAVSSTGNGSGIIQALGIGSGLDIQTLVSQLVSAEGAPAQNRLSRKSQDVGTQISALGSLKGALSSFQSALAPLKDAKVFNAIKATSGDATIFTANADSTAASGSYDVLVQQLASADKLLSKAYIAPSGSTSASAAVVGTGSLGITLGSTTISLNIDGTNNTLAGIRDTINNASNNPGVQASIVYGQDGAHLSLSSTLTGASNTLRITSSGGDGGLAQLEYAGAATPNYTAASSAADAIVSISGIVVHSSTNTVTGAIDGVTLSLVKADTGQSYGLNVASDPSSVTSNVQAFVNAYNTMHAKIASLSSYDSSTKQAGPMLGDPVLQGIDAQMRRLSLNEVSGLSSSYTSLASIGITSDASGKLSIDSTKLQAALTTQSTAVAQLFGSTGGIAARLDTALTAALGSGGAIAARDTSLQADQKVLTQQSTDLQKRLDVIQQRYMTQFTALDTALAQMKQTSTYLTQQLDSIAKISNSSSGK